MNFGEILKELLEQHSMTQRHLAKELNITPSALGNYIQNIREPDYNTLVQIANYFQVTTDFLLDHPVKSNLTHKEELLLHIFRSLTEEQKEFYLEQGKIFINQNNKKTLSNSPTLNANKQIG